MQRHAPFVPTTFVEGGKHQSVELSGRDRFKFFRRPVVPLVDQVHPTTATLISPQIPVHTQPARRPLPGIGEDPTPHAATAPVKRRKMRTTAETDADGSTAPSQGNRARDVSCQTDFRENDCQTDPFTPDYYTEDGAHPQVLALMELKYGAGLPAGLAEVEMIDRVKRRGHVEADLPQGGDNTAMVQRLTALENLEKVEWNEREVHIKQLQEQRLGHMASALEKREARREAENAKRIESVKQSKLDVAEKRLNKLQDKRMTATRKLSHQHSNPSKEMVHKDIITAYSTHGTRGKEVQTSSLVDRSANTNYDVRPTLLGFPEGVQELERTKAPQIEKIRKKDTLPPEDPSVEGLENNFRKRAARQVVRDLEFAQVTIDKAKNGVEAHTSIQDFYRATPKLVRPDTPTLVLQGDQDEDKEEALVLLQRLLRGRAVQNEFFEGKERCHGLIEELQAASRAKETEVEWRQQKAVEAYAEKQRLFVDGLLDQLQGDIVFGTLDYLTKELVRQGEAAKFEALKQQAEATRRAREDAELRTREAEEATRQKQDLQYRELLAVTDYAATTYLTSCFQTAARATAYDKALSEHISESAHEGDGTEKVDDKQAPRTEEERVLDDEALVCSLMDSFIIPQAVLEQGKKTGDTAVEERARAHQSLASCYSVMQVWEQ